VRAGDEFLKAGEVDNAIGEYKNALELNQNNLAAHLRIAFLLYNVKRMNEEAMAHLSEAMRIDPEDPRVRHDLGMAMLQQGKNEQAITHLSMALQNMPQSLHGQYKPENMHYALGMASLHTGKFKEAESHISQSVSLNPNNAEFHYSLAMVTAVQGNIDETLTHYAEAVRLDPAVDKSPTLHDLLGMNHARAGQFQKAVLSSEKALELARAAGEENLARQIEERIKLYKQNKPYED
jgi:Flp pilus assembly protein TadD